MSVDIHSKEGQVIRQLIPLTTIATHQFETLCNELTVETVERNTFLFTKKDTAEDLIYLIDGSITLQSGKLKVETIKSGTQSSRFAIAHQIPRKIDAYANTVIRFLRLNLATINALSNISYEEEDTRYMVIDEPEEEMDDGDWMTTLLKSPIFSALPPSNLQQIIMGLEEVSFEKGELIIKQGAPGDYYYIVKKGICLLSRRPSPNAKEIKLAQLRNQDTFGEDSLLSGEPRNVNITALSKITLLRLNKDKFLSLIKEPALQFISHAQIEDKLAEGAILLDIRTPDEYKNHHLPKSVNTPFFSLRMQLKIFDKTKAVLIVCADEKNSAAAAFLLLRNKFNAFIVAGGMAQAPKNTAAFSIDDGVETLKNDAAENETVTETTHSTAAIEPEKKNDQDLLAQENQLLKQLMEKLTAEKEELEKKYRLLYKQTEKLKAVLDSLKIGGD
jgi:rhodanese-related sulfurtransferase